MNVFKSTFSIICILGAFAATALPHANAEEQSSACFGCKAHFEKDKTISFPGFTLTFQGERQQKKPPAGGTYSLGNCFDFKVAAGKNTSVICWSSGTGDIGPTMFLAGGDCYSLELKEADGVGRLSENELVVKAVKREYCPAASNS